MAPINLSLKKLVGTASEVYQLLDTSRLLSVGP